MLQMLQEGGGAAAKKQNSFLVYKIMQMPAKTQTKEELIVSI
jgi:hypothetical protein